MTKLSDVVKSNKKQREATEAKKKAERLAASDAAYEKALEIANWYFRDRLPAVFEDEDAKPNVNVGRLDFRYKKTRVVIHYEEPDYYDAPIGASHDKRGHYEIYCPGLGTLFLGDNINQTRVLEFLEKIS